MRVGEFFYHQSGFHVCAAKAADFFDFFVYESDFVHRAQKDHASGLPVSGLQEVVFNGRSNSLYVQVFRTVHPVVVYKNENGLAQDTQRNDDCTKVT